MTGTTVAVLATLLVVPAVVFSGGARADHCRPGDEEVNDEQGHRCIGSIGDLFEGDDATDDTTPDTPDTPDSSTPDTGSDAPAGSEDGGEVADIAGALLDAIDDRFFGEFLDDPTWQERIGCPDGIRRNCPPFDDALSELFPLLREGVGVFPSRFTSALIFAAVRDQDAQLMFPSLAAGMPVVFQLTLAGEAGDEDAARASRRFVSLLISLDARARGFVS